MSENTVFSMPIHTPTYDVGPNRQLRLSALLRWQQEVGERHVTHYQLDWESLAEKGLAFVLARGCGVIHRLPHTGEAVRLETWSDHIRGAQFYRGYRLLDEAGNRLTESMAAFALVDVESHRLCRPTGTELNGLPSAVRESACPLPPALKTTPPLGEVGRWCVPHSAVDLNHHLNNTVYADLLTDFLPAALRERTPRAYALYYLTEAKEGEVLTLHYGSEGDEHYVEARAGDKRCFVGRVTL